MDDDPLTMQRSGLEPLEYQVRQSKREILMPSLQRLQRLTKAEPSQKEAERRFFESFSTFFDQLAEQDMSLTRTSYRQQESLRNVARDAERACQELCERGKSQLMWERLTEFVFKVVRERLEAVDAKYGGSKENQDGVLRDLAANW